MLDLDNFKLVNDTFSHLRRDMILWETGAKLNEFAKDFNKVSIIRLGGDEFIIFIKEDHRNWNISLILENLNKSFKTWEADIKGIKLSASIGALAFDKDLDKDYTF